MRVFNYKYYENKDKLVEVDFKHYGFEGKLVLRYANDAELKIRPNFKIIANVYYKKNNENKVYTASCWNADNNFIANYIMLVLNAVYDEYKTETKEFKAVKQLKYTWEKFPTETI